jgi:hypothetical protein
MTAFPELGNQQKQIQEEFSLMRPNCNHQRRGNKLSSIAKNKFSEIVISNIS